MTCWELAPKITGFQGKVTSSYPLEGGGTPQPLLPECWTLVCGEEPHFHTIFQHKPDCLVVPKQQTTGLSYEGQIRALPCKSS